MKKLLILAVAMLLLSFTQTETKKNYYSNGKLKDQVEIDNGMFNGKYTAWYYNGQKKAEGSFKNNQRVGKWTVYDSLGKLRMVREYENNFSFKTLTAKNGKGEIVSLPEKVNYELKRNKQGCFEYPEIEEKHVIFSDRNCRTIENNSTNSLLFDKKNLLDIIKKSINETNKPVAYTSPDFLRCYNVDSLKNSILIKNMELVTYKISEIVFFNSSWQLSETKIIGICPVVKDKNTGSESELFWIYYPEIRDLLAAEKITIKGDTYITNLEDLFFFRCFNSSIYNEEYKYDGAESDDNPNTPIKKRNAKSEMDLLDAEHDIWISLTVKN